MTFLLPIGLLGLLAIPIIVLLHMIRERRRRMTVPSLLLWANLPRRNEGERARHLPLTLLLLLQLLIAAALGLALARPQLFGALSNRPLQLAIILDSSQSMAANDGGTTRLARAQEQASALLAGLPSEGHATIISAGPTARIIGDGGAADVPALLAAVAQVRAGGTKSDLDRALTLAEAALDPSRSAQIVVLTDGAVPTLAPREVVAPVDWRQIGSAAPNRAIVAFAARPFGNGFQVYARLANYADASITNRLDLYADDQRLDSRNVSLNANGETELTWRAPADARTLRLTMAGNDALPADDTALINLKTVRPTSVQLVSARPDALRRALGAIAGVTTTVVAPGEYDTDSAPPVDLTIFDGFLPNSWPTTGILAINPPPGNPLLPVDEQTEDLSGQTSATPSPLLADLSLGGVNFGRTHNPVVTPEWAQPLLFDKGAAAEQPGDATGAPSALILRGRTPGDGAGEAGTNEIAIWAFDLGATNLPNRLAFPLLVARTVRDLTPGGLPAALQAGSTLTLKPNPRATEVRLHAPDGQESTVAAARTVVFDELMQPGWYEISEQGSQGQLFQGQVAVNVGSPLESDLRPQPAPILTTGAAGSTSTPGRSRGAEIWPWLALAALVLLLLEWAYSLRRTRGAPAR